MKSLTYFFRHPNPIYFSMEKLFHAVAGEVAKISNSNFFVKEINLPFASKLTSLRKNMAFVRRAQSDINHITGDVHYAILACNRKNINILTIHDCVLLYRYPKTNPRRWIINWLWYQLPVRKADAITVISENTKNDLLHFTNCAPSKIRVIPNFIDPLFQFVSGNFNKERTKLLFIGTAPNKNLDRLIEAIRGLSVELLIVGFINEEQAKSLAGKKIQYSLMNGLSDMEMREVYAEADLMIFPSVHEGFGLPIIEAQCTGRAVLTSNIEPMISVSGGAACLVDPYQVQSIREGLKKLIEDDAYRNDLIEKGIQNVERYRLENVTKQYSDLYTELIKRKAN